MQPQGALFNTAHIQAMIARLDGINQCDELQAAVNDAYASIQAQLDGITSQLAALQPLLALLQPPTSLTAIISWLKNFITSFLTPYLKPYMLYAAQVAELVAAIALLTAAIEQAAKRLTSCSITVPDLTMPPKPELPKGIL